MAYCAAQDIYDLFGKTNVEKWADLENTRVQTTIDARIARAIAWADAEVDDKLRGGPYTLPLDPVPTTITDAAARLAGAWMYDARGIEDVDASGRAVNKMQRHKSQAYGVLTEIRKGIRRLAATSTTVVPEIVDLPSDDEEESGVYVYE